MINKKFGARFSFVGYILFFVPLAITSGFAVMIYGSMLQKDFSTGTIALFLLLYIAFATLLFCLIDIIRRRLMVDRPVEQILEATQKIAHGDFNVKLIPHHTYYKYDEYDLVMENINKMTAELSKSEVLKTEFISNVSHEIKTPLSIIQSYAKALRDGKLDKPTQEKYLDTLVNTSKKLSNLVSNILKLNKLENQTISAESENINVGELLRENILQFEELFDKKNITLSCNISDIKMVVQSSYLELVFNNLISNAIKFSKVGGKIDILLTESFGNIVFIVKDNGIGMSKEVGEHIFEKFYQGDTSHSGEGNGLGLALVKRVIDIIGGEISVKSIEGEGSTFMVKLKTKNNEL